MTSYDRRRKIKTMRNITIIALSLALALAFALGLALGSNNRLRYEADRATCLETAMHHALQGENVYCDEDNQMRSE